MQTGAGMLQKIGGGQCNDNGQIGKKAIREENFPEPAALIGKGQRFAEIGAGGGKGDRGDLTAGQLNK